MALSKEEMILKQMTDNIDEPLLIVIDEAIFFPSIRMQGVTTHI